MQEKAQQRNRFNILNITTLFTWPIDRMAKKIKMGKYHALAATLLGMLAIYLIYVTSSVNIWIRIFSAFFVLFVSGIIIQRSLRLKGGYGLSLAGSKVGIGTIDSLSKKYGMFWEYLAMWGLTVGLGILAYPIVKGRIKKWVFCLGLISIIVMELYVVPYMTFGLQQINIPVLGSVFQQLGPPQVGYTSTSQLPILAVEGISGFTGGAFFSIIYNSASIIISTGKFLANPTPAGAISSGVTSQIPGIAPVIPGLTIPLFAGIIALAVLLIIHEFSHGVHARKLKIKIKSVGVLLFGFIPIGGFVEPDEKAVNKLKPEQQTNIFAAGIATNFAAMIIFFLLMLVFLAWIIPHVYTYSVVVASTAPGYPAYGVLKNGTQLLDWNGKAATNLSIVEAIASKDKPNQTVTLTTKNRTYSFKAIANPASPGRGFIGVSLAYSPIIATPLAKIVYFLFNVISLSMMLNFLVAIVNLLPIMGFDGWRIYWANINNKRAIVYAQALIVVLLIVNVVPWFFYLWPGKL